MTSYRSIFATIRRIMRCYEEHFLESDVPAIIAPASEGRFHDCRAAVEHSSAASRSRIFFE